MNTIARLAAACIAATALLTGCSRKADEGVLAHVPADTPYAFANREPLPDAVIEAWRARFEPLAGAYEKMLARAAADLAADTTPQARAARALLAELAGHVSLEGLERLGLDVRGRWAVYGVGLVPVMRAPLKDPAAFRAFVARVEQRYGEKLPAARVGDQDYWRIGTGDARLAGVLAVIGNEAVMSVVPAGASEPLLRRLLGLDPPERSLADTDAIAKLDAQYAFEPYGSGFVDTARVVERLADRDGIEREFLAAFELARDPLEPPCREELLGIAAKFPRMVSGYTRLDSDSMEQLTVLEAEPALAAELKSLAAPVPGLGPVGAGLFDFGMSLRLDRLKAVVDAHAAAVAAAPYRCAALAGLNRGFADAQTHLANPVSYAIAPVFLGFRAALTGFEPVEGGTPKVTGTLVVASPNPQSLVASARTFLAPLASLKLEPGAAPVPLPADAVPPGTPPVHAAATASALGVAVGEGEAAKLPGQLAAPAGDPPPLMAFGYDGTFMARMMELADPANAAATEAMDEAERAEMEETMAMVKAIYSQMFGRLDVSLVASDRGLELRQGMQLK